MTHRDIKPENLLFTGDRRQLKVADFGIARVLSGARTMATATGDVLGTPAYMAPEQATGGAVTPATDVYALGVTLFEMLSGELPFRRESPVATALARISETAPRLSSLRPGVDPSWDAVVATCLAREPVFRYAAVRDVLRGLQGGVPTPSLRPGLLETLPAEVSSFLGRTTEIPAAVARLSREPARLQALRAALAALPENRAVYEVLEIVAREAAGPSQG